MGAESQPIAYLKKRAKQLLKHIRLGEPSAHAQARLHPHFRGAASLETFKLSDAQFVIARQMGFSSWPALQATSRSGDRDMQISYTALSLQIGAHPSHFDAMVDFYENTLQLKRNFHDPQNHIATFQLPFGPVFVIEGDPDTPADRAPSAEDATGVNLWVGDVNKVYEHLKATGVRFLHPPHKEYWGAIRAHFADPGGNVLTLLQAPPAGAD